MRAFLILSFIALSQAQFLFDTVTREPWTGPIADHQIGIHPDDTPEVAAAKAQHLNAFKDVLAVLPELPPEERYIEHGLPLSAVRALQQQAEQKLNYVQNLQPRIDVIPEVQPVQPFIPVVHPTERVAFSSPPMFTTFAEEIPRSSIGEVPEVHAARVAHLKAFQEVRAALPPLRD